MAKRKKTKPTEISFEISCERITVINRDGKKIKAYNVVRDFEKMHDFHTKMEMKYFY